MIAFEVSINGKKGTTAGVGDYGVLSAIVSWVKRRVDGSEEMTFEVGGLISDDRQTENLRWLCENLNIGDEVTIRIVEVPQVEPASERKARSGQDDAEAEKAYYQRLKEKFEGK